MYYCPLLKLSQSSKPPRWVTLCIWFLLYDVLHMLINWFSLVNFFVIPNWEPMMGKGKILPPLWEPSQEERWKPGSRITDHFGEGVRGWTGLRVNGGNSLGKGGEGPSGKSFFSGWRLWNPSREESLVRPGAGPTLRQNITGGREREWAWGWGRRHTQIRNPRNCGAPEFDLHFFQSRSI